MAYSGYSINGIPLHNSARGWKILRAGTNTQGGVTRTLTETPNPGQPGYTPSPSTYTKQVLIFTVRTTLAGLESLLTLCAAATTVSRTDDPTKEAYCELASALPSSDAPFDSMQDVTITLNLYQGVYRDVTAVTVGPLGITTPSQVFDMLSGLSAPIFDSLIFISGVFGQFTLVDSGGSWLKTNRAWPGSATTGILWNGSTKQASLANTSSPFAPVSDASQYVDQSANGGFRLTPQLIGGDPANRQVELTLTTLTQTSTNLEVQAKRAYRMN